MWRLTPTCPSSKYERMPQNVWLICLCSQVWIVFVKNGCFWLVPVAGFTWWYFWWYIRWLTNLYRLFCVGYTCILFVLFVGVVYSKRLIALHLSLTCNYTLCTEYILMSKVQLGALVFHDMQKLFQFNCNSNWCKVPILSNITIPSISFPIN